MLLRSRRRIHKVICGKRWIAQARIASKRAHVFGGHGYTGDGGTGQCPRIAQGHVAQCAVRP